MMESSRVKVFSIFSIISPSARCYSVLSATLFTYRWHEVASLILLSPLYCPHEYSLDIVLRYSYHPTYFHSSRHPPHLTTTCLSTKLPPGVQDPKMEISKWPQELHKTSMTLNRHSVPYQSLHMFLIIKPNGHFVESSIFDYYQF